MRRALLLQAGAADSQGQLVSAAQQVVSQVQPAAQQAGEALVGAAQLVHQGAAQQGEVLAGHIEEAGQTLGECL